MKNSFELDSVKNVFSRSSFRDRIACLIAHGSSLFTEIPNETETYRDIDLELILDQEDGLQYLDYMEVKELIKEIEALTKKRVELQLRYSDEISNEDRLILDTGYKIFMYYAYANGQVLIGENIYKGLTSKLSKYKVDESLKLHIQISFKDIAKSYLKSSGDPYSINKNIVRTIQDVILYCGLIDIQKLGTRDMFNAIESGFLNVIVKGFKKFLDNTDVQVLEEFGDYYRGGKLYEKILPLLYEKILPNIESVKEMYDVPHTNLDFMLNNTDGVDIRSVYLESN